MSGTPLPKGLIDKNTAEAMEQLYIEHQHAAINRYNLSLGDKDPDSRETIFSIEEIERYIAYIKERSAVLGLKDLGIRVYQGAKEANGKKFTTIFFAPTNEGKNTMELLCLDLGTYGRPPTAYGSSGK